MKNGCRLNPFPWSPNRGRAAVDVPEGYTAPSILWYIGTPAPVDILDTNNRQLASDGFGPSCGDNAPDVHFGTKGPVVGTHVPRSLLDGLYSAAEKCIGHHRASGIHGQVIVLRAV